MPEPLKNRYTKQLIGQYAEAIAVHYSAFDRESFQRQVFGKGWNDLELKGRMRRITESLRVHLPEDYTEAVPIIKAAAPNFSGFEAMFFPEYIELYGIEDFKISVDALEHLTKFSSSEFAVRPFIVRHGDRMIKQMNKWAKSENFHVRRLASEGCRPRLPWAMALPDFKNDPAPVMPILETLKQDDSEYVRRSVANNLNDISKDHPEIAIKTAKRWHGNHPDTDWIVKHASRSLLKQGEPRVMRLFGFASPDNVSVSKFSVQPKVKVGERLEFSFGLTTTKKKLGRIRIEYAIHFRIKNGTHNRKVFKISEGDIPESTKSVTKSHSFKLISTRKYYSGEHKLEIIVNGVSQGVKVFDVI